MLKTLFVKAKKKNLIILRLPLVISEKPRLENKIAHVNERPPDLPAAIANHPTFVDNFRRHRIEQEIPPK